LGNAGTWSSISLGHDNLNTNSNYIKDESLVKDSIVPSRGHTEDWSVEEEEKLLEKKKKYAKRIMKEQAKGAPDFDSKYSTLLSTPTKKSDHSSDS
jgi:hypothetical protein